jgi:hypothetical protein
MASATTQTQPSGIAPALLMFHCDPVHVSEAESLDAFTAYTAGSVFSFETDAKFMYVMNVKSEAFCPHSLSGGVASAVQMLPSIAGGVVYSVVE